MSGLSRYRIEGELGRGAMGVVYLAHDQTLERAVALKELLLPPGLTPQIKAEMLDRFQREARSAARLAHPNVVQVYDVFDEGDRHFIAMELLEGDSLGDLLARTSVSPAFTVNVLLQVLDALEAAHAAGVVHRDIKPDNVFVLHDGRVKVADFGIAKVLDSQAGSKATQIGTLIGTPGYMSPEQVLGLPADGRSDLFAVGAMGYEMFSGSNPFAARSPTAILYRIANEHPPVLTSTGVSPGMAGVIGKALAKRPEDRYPTARSMADDIRAGRVGATASQLVDAHASTEARSRLLSPGFIAVGTAVSIALLVGVGFLVSPGGDPPTIQTGPVAEAPIAAVVPAAAPDAPPEAVEPVELEPAEAGEAPATPFWAAFFYANDSERSANARAAEVGDMGFEVLVLDTGDYDSIGKPGQSIWVACVGPFETESEASDASAELDAAGVKRAYPKEVY